MKAHVFAGLRVGSYRRRAEAGRSRAKSDRTQHRHCLTPDLAVSPAEMRFKAPASKLHLCLITARDLCKSMLGHCQCCDPSGVTRLHLPASAQRREALQLESGAGLASAATCCHSSIYCTCRRQTARLAIRRLEGRGVHEAPIERASLAGQALHEHPDCHSRREGVRVDDQIRPAAGSAKRARSGLGSILSHVMLVPSYKAN